MADNCKYCGMYVPIKLDYCPNCHKFLAGEEHAKWVEQRKEEELKQKANDKSDFSSPKVVP